MPSTKSGHELFEDNILFTMLQFGDKDENILQCINVLGCLHVGLMAFYKDHLLYV